MTTTDEPTPSQAVPAVSPDWVRRQPTADELRADLLIAVVLVCAAVLSMVLLRAAGGTVVGDPPAAWISVLCLALTLLPLAWRRQFPGAVTAWTGAAFIITTEIGVPEVLILNVGFFLALYSLGAWSRRRRDARIVRWTVLGAMVIWMITGFLRMERLQDDSGGFAAAAAGSGELAMMLYTVMVNILYFGAALWFGHHAWESARQRARTEEQSQALRAERERAAAQAVVLERLRIARELHDAVAHHVSLMGVQSAAARATLTSDPEAAARSMREVEDSARRSVAELKDLLGTLRQEDPEAEPGTIGPDVVDEALAGLDVDRIPQLIEQVRSHGMRIGWQVIGSPRELSPLTGLNLYRIVQESLTNVRKHAGPAAGADVRLRYGAESVEVEISDDGAGRRSLGAGDAAGTSGGGHGIAGMRERAAVGGGTLHAAPRTPHGFLVRAQIPYHQMSHHQMTHHQDLTTDGSSAGV